MLSRSALTKVEALFLIDVIIVATAVGIYFYLDTQGFMTVGPKPAEFTVMGLTINPLEVVVGEPISLSVNVTNLGEEEGTYSANLTINDVLRENQTIVLAGGDSTIVEFTVIELAEGDYTVKIASLSGSFNVKAPSPTSSKISLSKLVVNPYEGWVDEPITATVTATNLGGEPDSLYVRLLVDGSIVEAKKIDVATGSTTTVEFTFNTTSEGKHTVNVNDLSGTFMIVPTGYHTLSIGRTGGGSDPLPFTINGVSQFATYSELLPVGTYTITVPHPYNSETALFHFEYWNDGVTTPSRTIDLQSRSVYTVAYKLISGVASCPALLVWNGTCYDYVSVVSSRGYLGYINYINEDGWPVNWRNYPWDYIKLDQSKLQPRNGYYDLILNERSNEIFYLDSAHMIVVDHPSNVNVYTTMGEQYLDPNYMGQIYTVSKNPLTPTSAFNEKGEDVLTQISKIDGVYTTANNGIYSESFYNISWNRLTLNLGDLSGAKQIKLIVNGILDWGPDEDQGNWYGIFFTQQVPNGTQPTPPPYMEVKDENGNWMRVPENRQFPLLPDETPRTFVVDLTDLFPTDDYSLRINNFWNVTFDYIGVDTTPQENVTIQRINPAHAELDQAIIFDSAAVGAFTRYGDVTQLVLNADDKFVIGKRGESVYLLFEANLAPVAEGFERDFFVITSLWFKEEGNPGVEFTVDPLPFQSMSSYPYPSTEKYPSDGDHLGYLREYNTRTLPILHAQLIVGDLLIGIIVAGLVIAGLLAILIGIKERVLRARSLRIKTDSEVRKNANFDKLNYRDRSWFKQGRSFQINLQIRLCLTSMNKWLKIGAERLRLFILFRAKIS